MNVHEISNAAFIDYLDIIIHQESQKLKKDKTTGLLGKSIDSSQIHHLQSENQSECLNSLKLSVSKNDQSYSPKQSHLYERDNEIERLANIFTQSPSFFTSNNNNNYSIDSKHNQALLKERVNTQTYNEGNNRSEKVENYNKTIDDLIDMTKHAPFIDNSKTCANDDQFKEHNKMKQELYRHELMKQIEEKKLLDEERKRKEQITDEEIERAAKERDEKLRKEYEREIEERALLQLQKRLIQEKLKDELLEKQKSIETKSWKLPITTFSKPEKKQIPTHCEFPNNYKFEQLECPPQNAFDDVPLPTTIVRPPRKIMYNDTVEELKESSINEPDNFSINNIDTYINPCMNHRISPPIMRPKMRVGKNAVRQPIEPPAHVTFATDPPIKRDIYNPAAILPDTKSVIIDSPLTLALVGKNIDEDTTSKAINKPIKTSYNHSVPERIVTLSDLDFSDKDLLSNLGNIRKQLDIDHQNLKQKLKNS
ncbi:uncharacterized protein LOC126847216 isoform X2 [Adelges cooleyi]|uniref:uncharacterized protein LOC126847216 isoform X2 n=1 Tax=Adelges cooleyi TaxID=133065 RepID=UPI0021801D18|nr:uncharacterized protein LOC126847216 isoform X2 [Adelges cooleyi]